jgi:hypothetical protein
MQVGQDLSARTVLSHLEKDKTRFSQTAKTPMPAWSEESSGTMEITLDSLPQSRETCMTHSVVLILNDPLEQSSLRNSQYRC